MPIWAPSLGVTVVVLCGFSGRLFWTSANPRRALSFAAITFVRARLLVAPSSQWGVPGRAIWRRGEPARPRLSGRPPPTPYRGVGTKRRHRRALTWTSVSPGVPPTSSSAPKLLKPIRPAFFVVMIEGLLPLVDYQKRMGEVLTRYGKKAIMSRAATASERLAPTAFGKRLTRTNALESRGPSRAGRGLAPSTGRRRDWCSKVTSRPRRLSHWLCPRGVVSLRASKRGWSTRRAAA